MLSASTKTTASQGQNEGSCKGRLYRGRWTEVAARSEAVTGPGATRRQGPRPLETSGGRRLAGEVSASGGGPRGAAAGTARRGEARRRSPARRRGGSRAGRGGAWGGRPEARWSAGQGGGRRGRGRGRRR